MAILNRVGGQHVPGEQVTSGTYAWQLRTGRRDNPTYKLLTGLSRFFKDTETERGTIPPHVALAQRDDAVRDIALRSAGLSSAP